MTEEGRGNISGENQGACGALVMEILVSLACSLVIPVSSFVDIFFSSLLVGCVFGESTARGSLLSS